MKLQIKLTAGNDDNCLVTFPLLEEQYIESGENCGEFDLVTVDLADRDDTTAAQEAFLDSLECCVSYDLCD